MNLWRLVIIVVGIFPTARWSTVLSSHSPVLDPFFAVAANA
jgi:hypothetical protein